MSEMAPREVADYLDDLDDLRETPGRLSCGERRALDVLRALALARAIPIAPDGAEACHAYEGEEHNDYLSPACFNGRHRHCASPIRMQGVQRPATCRFCDARCCCSCHGGAA